MSLIETYAAMFAPSYDPFPHGRFISAFLVRHVQSEAIFRTEGSGEPLNKEFVFAGEQDGENELIQRVVISKRKQTAVERRTGRELLRIHELLHAPSNKGKKETPQICSLNTNNPCEHCIDCMIYGFAAGGGGAQRSRVITDDAFSLHPSNTIIGTRQFNALFDNSTMRNPITGEASTSIGTDEYIKPQSIFFDIETFKDVTKDEFRYILGNILRSSRYGAVSSRIGKVRNYLVGLAFSNCELFSNLEWVQSAYDAVRNAGEREPNFPLHPQRVIEAAQASAAKLRQRVAGNVHFLTGQELQQLEDEMNDLYANEDALQSLLRRLDESYPRNK